MNYDRDTGHIELRGHKEGEWYRVLARYMDQYAEGVARSLPKAVAFALENLSENVRDMDLIYGDEVEDRQNG